MKLNHIVTIVLALVLMVSSLAIWVSSSVQDFMDANTNWNGIQDFYQRFEITSVEDVSDLAGVSPSAILVVIPYLPYAQDEIAGLNRFILGGGTILLMDDFGFGNGLLERFGVEARFSAELLLDPLFCDRNPLLPRISLFAEALGERGINLVTMNRGTTLTGVSEANALAWSSPSSFLDANADGVQDRDEPAGSMVLAARYNLGLGALVVVSDPSIAINTMLARGDNLTLMEYLLFQHNAGSEVLLDRSHLVESTLDVSKTMLLNFRESLSRPQSLVGVAALVMMVISLNVVGKGNRIG
jgi:hypothetical protein